MSAKGLGSRAIIGEFYRRLEQDLGASWIPSVSMYFGSDQDSETYKWLGQTPAMREWVGGRNAKGFTENGITIENKHYEATLEVLVREARRDKTGQVMVRVRELAQRANAHWAKLLSTLILNGPSTVCYDGQFFFDTDHSEGSSGTQSNDISVDISALATTNHGSVTAPSVGEMREAILQGARQITSFVDDQGEPMNENASEFLVMVPNSLMHVAAAAVQLPMVDSGEANIIPAYDGMRFRVASNVRLDAGGWTDEFAVFRTDGSVAPFIRQEEQGIRMSAKAEGSEYEFDNDAWQFGIDTWRNVGYGYWQKACLVTMV